MFRVSTNIEQAITKKKKLLFISTLSSNETSSIEQKNNENPKTISKSSSLSAPLPVPKKTKKCFNNLNNNLTNHKILPMKRILFRLYHVNFLNPKREKGKSQSKNKKENTYKKNGNYNIKHKQKHIQSKNSNISYNNKNFSTGRWKSDEHQRFIDAIIRYGNNWRQVQKCVGTRSSTQTRSHAQKFFEKLKRSKIFKRDKYDFSKNSLKILHDIMQNLPDKEYNQTLKALHSLSFERNSNSENDKNSLQNNNGLINFNSNFSNFNENKENKENNYENKIYDVNNNNINNEENIKYIKIFNQGYCFLENNNNNNKLYNNDDYLFYNNSYNGNNNNSIINYNNYLINDYLNYDTKSYGRKESDTFNQRKNSLSEMNLNIKDLKEQNNNVDDFNLDYNLNTNICNNNNNNFNLNPQQDNKNIINKIFEINEDKMGYKQQFTNLDFIFNQQTSRKMSLEEKQ